MLAEVERKIAKNEAKYPVDKAKGSSKKQRGSKQRGSDFRIDILPLSY